MSLVHELLEISPEDLKIVKSFRTKDTLSKDIFEKKGDDYVMHSDVRKKLLDVTNNFIESLGIDFFIHDIYLLGSLANYNWSSYSDVDLHVVLDVNEFADDTSESLKKIFTEFFDAKKQLWNEKRDVKIKGFDVEIYAQDINEKVFSEGIYSVLNNKWITVPEKQIRNIDEKKILKKAEEYAKKIDRLAKEAKHIDVSDELTNLRTKLKEFRKSGLESGGEFSYENLTFKLLRRNGYISKLLDIKSDLIDKKLSIAD